jgi:hypothetical protein
MHSLPAQAATDTAACCPFVLLPSWHYQCCCHPTKKPQTPDQSHQIHRPSKTAKKMSLPLVDTAEPGSIHTPASKNFTTTTMNRKGESGISSGPLKIRHGNRQPDM